MLCQFNHYHYLLDRKSWYVKWNNKILFSLPHQQKTILSCQIFFFNQNFFFFASPHFSWHNEAHQGFKSLLWILTLNLAILRIIAATNTIIVFIRFVCSPGRSNSSFPNSCHKVLLSGFPQSKGLGRCCVLQSLFT